MFCCQRALHRLDFGTNRPDWQDRGIIREQDCKKESDDYLPLDIFSDLYIASLRKGGYMETKSGGTSTNVQPKKVGAWARMVAEYSWFHLWLAEIGCILFVLGGIFILRVDPKEWLMA